MKNRIALGFQNTVDFELEWDSAVLEALIWSYKISDVEIGVDIPIHTERDIILVLLGHMKAGTGTERIVSSSNITREFAEHFSKKITLGGTAIRAAIAMSHIGCPSTVHACSNNHYFRSLMPANVSYLTSVPDEADEYCPHVIVQFPVNARISAGDIDIVTPRPNRVIFAYDPPSVCLIIDENFKYMAECADVFLAASYNAIKDESLLQERLTTSLRIIEHLPSNCLFVMEDACFQSSSIRAIVTKTLTPRLDIFSMNEDELQDRLGHRIDILDPQSVSEALSTVAQQINVPLLICHSAYWALAYGKQPSRARQALEGGIAMASTRFRLGDKFGKDDYLQTMQLPANQFGIIFSTKITKLLGTDLICCLAGKNLDFVKKPTTIGLGDAFIGGILPNLLPERLI